VRVAQSRSRRYLRGLAVATIACGPALTFALPAHGEDLLGAVDPPSSDTTTTTTVPEPAPLEGTPVTTLPPEVTTPTTEVTTPTTELPTTDTTTPPDTTTTTGVTTPTTVPEAVPVVPPVTDPPSSGSTGTSTRGGTHANDTAKADAKGTTTVLLQVGSPTDAPVVPFLGEGGLTTVPHLVAQPLVSTGKAVAAASRVGLSAAFGGSISPVSSDRTWGGLGSAGPRFAPWIVLLAMAWIVRTVIGSILADRTGGPRRRRWTLL
jgi:hypothetical protein